ncbi:MAG: hypothetical protein EOL98_00705 [Negativicutes bacterium]|nr:hypothetical protein [Negativicutes bacterium]
MHSSAKKSDKFASVLLASFLIMGSAHFACRYDVGSAIESLFQKASAESTASKDFSVDRSANNSLSEQLASDNGIITKSITRNPFLMPTSAAPLIAQSFKNGASSAAPVSSVPAFAAEPQLRGIVRKGDKSMAIIEYKGMSNYYEVGQKVGSYAVSYINAKSVTLDNSEDSLELHVGGSGK